MTLGAARALCSHLAAGLAFGAMASGGDFGRAAEGAFVAVAAVSVVKADRPLPNWLGRVLVGLLVSALPILVLEVLRGAVDGVIATGGFCAALTLNRLLARRGPQDEPSVYLSAFFMLTIGAALTGELTYGACFVGFAIAVTVGLTLTELDRQADASKIPAAARKSVLTPPLVRWLIGLSAGSLLMSGGFFVFFPRVNSRWAFARHAGANPNPLIGFGTRVELGGEGTLRDDPRPVLRIQLPELRKQAQESGRELAPRLDDLFRGEALDTFDGRAWSVGKQRSRMVRSSPPPGFDGTYAEIDVLPVADAALVFSPGPVVGASLLGTSASSTLHLRAREGGDVVVSPKPQGRYQFRVWAAREPEPPALAHRGRDYPDEVRVRDLQLPDGLDPRVAQLAREWTRGLSDPAEQAAAIRRRLHEDYAYTLELPGEVPDPLAHFLFERRAGHCEFFSTAMVILLRTLGVPAREVTGFAGAVLAPGGDYYLARAGDAHSWVEVFFPGLGFASFDPTPPSFRTAEASEVQTFLAGALDVLELRWQTSVVDYDLLTQVRGLRDIVTTVRAAVARFEKPPETGNGFPRWILAVGAGIGLAFLLTWRYRSRRTRAPETSEAEARVAYESLLSRLVKRGLVRHRHETPREFANRVAGAPGREQKALQEMTRLHEEARFGNRPWTEAERQQARAILESLSAG